MLTCQKHLFQIPEHISYLNGAYMSPLLQQVEQIGHQMVARKSLPFEIYPDDFFRDTQLLKQAYAKLIDCSDAERIAIIPSVSYGIANVTNNIHLKKGQHIIMMEEQFPSNYYPWKRLADQSGASIKMIKAIGSNRTTSWNEQVLEAINEQTAVVTIGTVHWADGTPYDLKAIRQKTREHGALLILDGTQSVGALPFSVADIEPDALICAGYKWLMGPYSIGLAYYGTYFDGGVPIEENWINRRKSEDFSGLVNYALDYKPKANRYSVGEQSNFILVPMLKAAIEQLNIWKPALIQAYCHELSKEPIAHLQELGCQIEGKHHRCGHLFGIRLNEQFDLQALKQSLIAEHVFVSFRGNSIRVSPNVYNEAKDFDVLLRCFRNSRR